MMMMMMMMIPTGHPQLFKVHVQSLLHILVSTWLNLKKTPFSVHSCTTSFSYVFSHWSNVKNLWNFPFLGLVCVLLMIYYIILGHLWKCLSFVILAGVVNLTVFHLTNRRVSKACLLFSLSVFTYCVSQFHVATLKLLAAVFEEGEFYFETFNHTT